MKDTFNREIDYLRLSVTDLCNLRCRYCMPEEGVCKKSHQNMLTQEEMLTAVKACASLGIKKVRLTGGEPLVKTNILDICEGVRSIEGIQTICMTTNGIRLKAMAKDLKAAGIQRLNISLDTLNADRFRYITRIGNLSDVLEGIRCAIETGFEKVKINTVLYGGFNDDEIAELAKLTQIYPVDVRFIELMPMDNGLGYDRKAFISCETVLEKLKDFGLSKVGMDGVSRTYRLSGAQANIGLISPLSLSFCQSCNRIRITADGKVKPCLHSGEELSIKGLDYDGMKAVIEKAILAKPACHKNLSFDEASDAGRTMNRIGG